MLVQSKHLALLLFFFTLTDIAFVLGTCSSACVSCTNDTCMKCDIGSYLESGTCHSCPENCTSCNNYEVCYNCTEGYFGLSCDKNCISSKCLNNTCDKDSGICLHGCIEGYFLSGSSCLQCSAGCKTCANFSNNCLECKECYYGSSCQYPCSNCKEGVCTRDNCTYGCSDGFFKGSETCNQCNQNCRSCDTFQNCHACVDGYFGKVCQFMCSDCSPCGKANGSCPLTTTDPASTTTTQPSSSTKESVTTSFPTTTISTTIRPSTSTTQRTGTSKQSISTFFPTTTMYTTMTSTSQDSTSTSGKDNTRIIYATAGGGGGLVVIILAIVVVCKRGGSAKQSDNVAESIAMTENENYISADDINNLTPNSSNVRKEVQQNEQENNDALYSQPNKIHRPTMVSIQTISTETTEGSSSNISPTIPAKNNVYSDLI